MHLKVIFIELSIFNLASPAETQHNLRNNAIAIVFLDNLVRHDSIVQWDHICASST